MKAFFCNLADDKVFLVIAGYRGNNISPQNPRIFQHANIRAISANNVGVGILCDFSADSFIPFNKRYIIATLFEHF